MSELDAYIDALKRISKVYPQIHKDSVEPSVRPYFINTLRFNRLAGFAVGFGVGLLLGSWLG